EINQLRQSRRWLKFPLGSRRRFVNQALDQLFEVDDTRGTGLPTASMEARHQALEFHEVDFKSAQDDLVLGPCYTFALDIFLLHPHAIVRKVCKVKLTTFNVRVYVGIF